MFIEGYFFANPILNYMAFFVSYSVLALGLTGACVVVALFINGDIAL